MRQVDKGQASGEAKFRVSALVRSVGLHKRDDLRFIFHQFLEASSDNILPSSPDLKISARGQLIDLVNPFLMVHSKDESDCKRETFFEKDQNFARISHPSNTEDINLILVLSPYTLAVIKDDVALGNLVHIFDLSFQNTFQWKGISVNSGKIEDGAGGIRDKIRLNSDYKDGELFLATITGHQAMTIEQHISITGIDPVMKYAVQKYYDPDLHWLHKKETFSTFLNKEREYFTAPSL